MTARCTRVTFDSDGVTCVGYLYVPLTSADTLPCVVLAHGFSGTQDTPSIRAAAQDFSTAGFAALTFDYRNFGESGGTPRQLIAIDEQQADVRAAVRYVRSDPLVDPARIALWGTSLGGGHVIAVAADDPRIAAVVAQIPFNGFPKRVKERSQWAATKLLWAMIDDALRGWLRLPPYYVPVVGPSGTLAVIASPDAQQAIAGWRIATWRNEVAPRVLFEMMRYKPSAQAHRLTMPVLVCIAEYDQESPPHLTRQLAEQAPHGELRRYACTHFDFYREGVRARVIRDQLDFLLISFAPTFER